MVASYGDYDLTETVVIPFNAFTSDDPSESVTVTNLINTDVEVYKDGSLTARISATHSGIAVDIDVNAVAGAHWVTIDLSDDDDTDFYAAGSRYQVMIVGTTIDGGTVNAWIGAFSIGCTLRPTTAGRTLDIQATGEVDANVTMLLGTAPTETAGGYLAGAFTKFFDIQTPTGTVNSLPDAAADAAGGLPVSDAGGLDLDAILEDTAEIGAAGAGLTAVKKARFGA